MDVKVGNEIIILNHSRYATEPEKGVVAKVARKYFTVEITRSFSALDVDKTYIHSVEFAIDGGRERGDKNYRSSYGLHAYTLEAYAEKQVREVAIARFKAFGLRFEYSGTYTESTISTEKLLAINEILGASDDG